MPDLKDSDIADLVIGTLDDLGPPRFQQVAQNYQDYEVFPKWMQRDKVLFDSGKGIKRTLMTQLPNAARHVGLYEEDIVNVADLMDTINMDWKHVTVNWAFERREVLENRGKALVVNVVKPRRAGALVNLVELLETAAWTLASTASRVDPYGIPYWVVQNASEGFNGGNPSGYSDVAGIDCSAEAGTNWKNYTGTYSQRTKPDLGKLLRRAHRKTGWKSPVTVQDLRGSMGQRRRLYVNETTISDLEDLAEAQNDNLGRDIASFDGTAVFRKHPIVWVPYLDSDTTDPIYMIDHATFFPVVLRGDYLHESDPAKAAKMHNVFEVFVDLTYQYFCVDRRRNAVVYEA